MGLRVVCGVLLAAGVALQAVAEAQETTASGAVTVAADVESNGESGALVPPEVAFASEEQGAIDTLDAAASSPDVAGADALDARGFYDRYRRFNTRGGATGGFHLVDPSTGMPGSFRIQLATDFFSSSDYLHDSDDVDVTRHVLSMSWTATDTLELFGTLTSRASSYEIPMDAIVGSNKPQSLAATGDLGFGLKLGGVVSGPFSMGGDARVLLYSGEGKGSPELEATGMELRASAAIDLRRQPSPVPFIARFNLGYTIDNTGKLAGEREAARYATLGDDARPLADETRHLANRFERLAFGMNRVDMLGLGLGLELPLFVANDFYLHPMAEWTWGIPINRQAYNCAHVAMTDVGSADDFEDSCLNDEGLSASPMVLSLGLRLVTPLRGFSAFAGIDIGLLGTSTFVRELAPTAPYAVLLGVAVDYDARPAPVQVVEREVVVQAAVEAPVFGRVTGTVVDQNLGTPVALANVRIADRDLSAVQTNDAGTFVSFDLPPGDVRFHVTHPDYEPGDCAAQIPAEGGTVSARCSLAALPRKGSLKLRVLDVWGAPLAGASVQLNGPVVVSLNANAEGVAQSDDLAAGQYSVRVDAPNHYLRVASVEIVTRQSKTLDVTLTPRAAASRAELRGSEIRLTGTVRFARGAAVIDATLAPVLADLADLLLRNPQLAHVRVEGPNDVGGDPMLGLTRALAIKQRLVDAGVDAGRVNAIAGETPRVKVVAE